MQYEKVRERFDQWFQEEGSLDGLYSDEVVNKTIRVMQEPPVWNLLRRHIREVAKSADGYSASFVDDWVKYCNSQRRKMVSTDEGEQTFRLGDHVELANVLIDDMSTAGAVVYDYNKFWQCDDNFVWRPVHDDSVKRLVHSYSGRMVVTADKEHPIKINSGDINGVSKVAAQIVSRSGSDDQNGFFDDAPPGIMLADRFVRFDPGAREVYYEEPSMDKRAMVYADIQSDQMDNYECPKFDRYLQTVFDGLPDRDQVIDLYLQMMGAALVGLGGHHYQKAFSLYDATPGGNGSNGKSVGIQILSHIMPSWLTTSVSPVNFDNPNYRSQLAGRRVNLVTEMPEDGDYVTGEHTKAIIAGDPIQAEDKYKAPYWFRPRAVVIAACNRFWRVRDTSGAFWRRWMVIPFPNTFDRSNADPGLVADIIRDEKEGAVCRMVRAAIRLVYNGGFIEPPSSMEYFGQWRRQCNPVEQFLMDVCPEFTGEPIVIDDGSFTSAKVLYEMYKDWCAEWGFRPLGRNRFSREVGALVPRKRIASKRGYAIEIKGGSPI